MHTDKSCEHEHEHSHTHSHEHSHEGANHSHPHTHEHSHELPHADGSHSHPHVNDAGGHSHSHADDAETFALLNYMLEHNRHHADELRAIEHELAESGKTEAAAELTKAISFFESGNQGLDKAIALLCR